MSLVRPFARPLAFAAVALVAWKLLGDGRRDLVLVYDLSAVPEARGLEVEVVRRDGTVLRRAEFRLGAGDSRVRQTLELSDGDYLLRGWIDRPQGRAPWERPLEVSEDGTIVLAPAP